jgi:hypothetical protein
LWRLSVSALLALVAGGGCALLAGLGDEYAAGPVRDASSTGDAGTPSDAGSADRVASDVGATACADAGYLFCDDFERTLSAWTVPGTALGTVSIDTKFACRGSGSAHFVELVTTPNSGDIYELALKRPSAFPDHFYVRVFVRFEIKPNPDIAFLETYGGPAGVQEEVNSGQFEGENFNFGTNRGWSDVPPRIGQCDCIEMEVDRTKGDVVVSVNGTQTSTTSYGTIPALDTLQIGPSAKAPSTQPFTEEMWMDDVAYDSKPIGCAR